MKGVAVAAALAISVASGAAVAGTAHASECQVEEWRADYDATFRALTVEGVATCERGEISLRLYDGKGENRTFLGVGYTYILNYVFEARESLDALPDDLQIMFIIKPR